MVRFGWCWLIWFDIEIVGVVGGGCSNLVGVVGGLVDEGIWC